LLLAVGTRNVRSLTLDLKHEDGREVIERLVESADILVHNFRPGVMERLGLGYEDVSAINPKLIYAVGSGYGSDHEYSSLPGQDLLLQGHAGLASVTGPGDRAPSPTGAPIVDAHGGTLLALGMLGALHHQRRTGEGQRVEVTMLQAALDLQGEPFLTYLNGETEQLERANVPLSSTYARAPTGIYPTRDGHIAFTASTPSSLEDLSQVLGSPDILKPYLAPDVDTLAEREAIYNTVAGCTRERTTSDLVDACREARLWCAPVLTYAELLDDPVVQQVDPVAEVDHRDAGTLRVLKHPIRYGSGDAEIGSVAPDVGEHTTAILGELGYEASSIEQLRTDGVV
jgi:crotonobetainyl-CoA:carnitine CoA-transferase CaiB-like acyl-CoA transferase